MFSFLRRVAARRAKCLWGCRGPAVVNADKVFDNAAVHAAGLAAGCAAGLVAGCAVGNSVGNAVGNAVANAVANAASNGVGGTAATCADVDRCEQGGDDKRRLADVMASPACFLRAQVGGRGLVDRPVFERALADCFAGHGAFVVWAPPESGKTTCLRQAAAKWVAQGEAAGKRRHVCWISSYTDHVVRQVSRRLCVRDTDDLQAQLSGTDYEVLVVLDQFDEAFHRLGDAPLPGNVVELAAASVCSKRFRVVVAVHDPVHAAKVLSWNARKKIFLCGALKSGDAAAVAQFKWTEPEVRAFLDAARPRTKPATKPATKPGTTELWTSDDEQAFVIAACKSSRTSTMERLLGNKAELYRHADLLVQPDMSVHTCKVQPDLSVHTCQVQADADKWTDGIAYLQAHARDEL